MESSASGEHRRDRQTNTTPPRVVAIINPAKTRAIAATSIIQRRCDEAGWPAPVILHTTSAEPGGSQAWEALDLQADIVLAGGGDGTAREVASGLAGTGVPLGIIPLGTANLLARNLGIRPANLDRNIRAALFGNERHIDIGRASFQTADVDEETNAVFLVVAGFGMDAAAFAHTSRALKRWFGWIAYIEAISRRLFRSHAEISLTLDDGVAETLEVQSVLVANCGSLPAGISLIPGALMDDGELDVVVMAPKTPFGWIPIAGKILLRHRYTVRTLHHRTARSVVIQPMEPIAMQLDGDVIDKVSRAFIQIEPGALCIRTPDR